MPKLQKTITIALMSSISLLLYYFKIPLPLFPGFLTLDFSDLPSLAAAFILGPVAGIVVQLVKNILDYLLHGNYAGLPIGQLANFLSGSIMIGLISVFFLWRKKLDWKSFAGSIILFLAAMYALNLYFILPAIMKLLGLSTAQYLGAFTPFSPFVKNLSSAVLFVVLPFNLLKISLVYLIGIPFAIKLKGALQKRRFAI
ncbi:ECF transporter S component [Metabacillus sp. GX 13764]|uniref:ECF transporter S component n=1 Tax=Metabacillus kandeliae TaxID=2900151 RepID=UPI001E2EF416|nr:ECF transporter S component [Metabacillus kandeliae]MCD7034188.1 ECF transporter S component [Metabacillus kandeliae]